MLFPVILFLLVLSPLYIPVGATLYDVFEKLAQPTRWASHRLGSPVPPGRRPGASRCLKHLRLVSVTPSVTLTLRVTTHQA